MKTQETNLFIVDDDVLMLTALKHYLYNRFGNGLRISTFTDGESCLKKVDEETDIVILDYHMEGKNGLDVLKSIKSTNPKTEVIMLSSNEDKGVVLETFKVGAKDYIIKGQGAWRQLTSIVNYIVTEPIRIMVEEFGVSKFMAIFLMTFITMATVVSLILKFFT